MYNKYYRVVMVTLFIVLCGSSYTLPEGNKRTPEEHCVAYVCNYNKIHDEHLSDTYTIVAYRRPDLDRWRVYADASKGASLEFYYLREENLNKPKWINGHLVSIYCTAHGRKWIVAYNQKTKKCYGIVGFEEKEKEIINSWAIDLAPERFRKHPDLFADLAAICLDGKVIRDWLEMKQYYLKTLNDPILGKSKGKEKCLEKWESRYRKDIDELLKHIRRHNDSSSVSRQYLVFQGCRLKRITIDIPKTKSPKWVETKTLLEWEYPKYSE